MWRSKSRQNDLRKRDLGLWSNLQGVIFPAAGAENQERDEQTPEVGWLTEIGTDGKYLAFDEGI